MNREVVEYPNIINQLESGGLYSEAKIFTIIGLWFRCYYYN